MVGVGGEEWKCLGRVRDGWGGLRMDEDGLRIVVMYGDGLG